MSRQSGKHSCWASCYRDRLLYGAPTNQTRHRFNPGQSTHTASVHKSVSQSAANLNIAYGSEVQESTLTQIKYWILELDEHEVQKRAIKQLAEGTYDFIDPGSNITTKQLLSLIWLAMHDTKTLLEEACKQDPTILALKDEDLERNTQEVLTNAQTRVLQALFDIQRSYNLTDDFADKGGEDIKACASGTFNKLIKSLAGVQSLTLSS